MKARLIHDMQSFFDTRAVYQSANVPWKRGVILHGVPGNGKTVSVKALINSLASREDDPIPSLYVKSLDGCAGPKYSIQLIFKQARRMAPCLLVFEDLDSLVTPKTRSYFLNEVDGHESNDGILMIGWTNYLDRLDAAITKRPSRFDRKYHFKLPDEKARLAYAQYWRGKFKGSNNSKSGNIDFPEALCPLIAKITEGFSFAYMKELFIASLLTFARGGGGTKSSLEKDISGDSPSPPSSAASEVSEPVIVAEDAETGSTEIEEGSSPKLADKKEVAKKVRIPRVEIPDDLKDNALVRIILGQATILLCEMASTDENDVPMACGDSCDEPPMFSPAWFAAKAAQL